MTTAAFRRVSAASIFALALVAVPASSPAQSVPVTGTDPCPPHYHCISGAQTAKTTSASTSGATPVAPSTSSTTGTVTQAILTLLGLA